MSSRNPGKFEGGIRGRGSTWRREGGVVCCREKARGGGTAT